MRLIVIGDEVFNLAYLIWAKAEYEDGDVSKVTALFDAPPMPMRGPLKFVHLSGQDAVEFYSHLLRIANEEGRVV